MNGNVAQCALALGLLCKGGQSHKQNIVIDGAITNCYFPLYYTFIELKSHICVRKIRLLVCSVYKTIIDCFIIRGILKIWALGDLKTMI